MKKKEKEKYSEIGGLQEKDEDKEEEYEGDEDYDEDEEDEWYDEDDEEYEEDAGEEDMEANLDENVRKVVDAVKKGLEANADCSLVREHAYRKWLHVYRLEEKKIGFYVPIEIHFNPLGEVIHLRFELSLGLHEVLGGDDSINEIADFYLEYADFIETREQEILKLGFYLEDSQVDGIHHLNFNYQKDYPPKKIDELIKDLKKIVEEIY